MRLFEKDKDYPAFEQVVEETLEMRPLRHVKGSPFSRPLSTTQTSSLSRRSRDSLTLLQGC